MPVIIVYLLKLSISLGLVWGFYQLSLRRLTFYRLNRWYLLGYSLLCLFIPLINIGPLLEQKMQGEPVGLDMIPVLDGKLPSHSGGSAATLVWGGLLVGIGIGGAILLVRSVIRWRSLHQLRNQARLIQDGPVRIYQVDLPITPFSFGRSIYINGEQHTDAEWEEIILHEYVHVRERHTVDILLAELLCVINWYNPFSWLIRFSIRQNLEFIADDKVLQNGSDKKSYQYHLLKVVGHSRYVLANNFNFSSLKKRIVMMNKVRTARVHLIKFLFVVPLVAVLLLAFRGVPNMSKTATAVPVGEWVTTIDGSSGMPPGRSTEAVGVHSRSTQQGALRISLDTVPKSGDSLKSRNSAAPFPETFRLKRSGKPLILINGKAMPEDFELSSINADDIESITVMKDASAKAAYGSGAADGVVSIITKDGMSYRLALPAPGTILVLPEASADKAIRVTLDGSSNAVTPVTTDGGAAVTMAPGVSTVPFAPGMVPVVVPGTVPVATATQGTPVLVTLSQQAAPSTGASASTIPVMLTPTDDKPVRLSVTKAALAVPPNIHIRYKRQSGKVPDALYFVDGVETSNEEVAKIKPEDIASIDVYKDEATIKKYGDRAKNGVLMISLKKSGGK